MNQLPAAQSATLPATHTGFREPLPDAWIGRVFDRLSALYGSKFADLWAGTDPAMVRATWASKLAGFRDMPAAIRQALDACDSRIYPPNLPEFLAMCREEAKRLEPKPPLMIRHEPTAEEKAARLEMMKRILSVCDEKVIR